MSQINALMNEINWLVSLLVAVPLSIAGNLLTPVFLDWRSRRSKTAGAKRLRTLIRDHKRLERFAAEPVRLNTYLLVTLLSALLLFAIPGVISGFSSMFTIVPPVGGSKVTSSITFIAGFASAVFNLNAVMIIVRTFRIYRNVMNFSQYRHTIEARIESLRNAA
jgi:hypothetical protein